MASASGGTFGVYTGLAASAIDADALPYTLLSLNRYARIMQIDPAHFNQLASATIFPLDNKCSDIWFRYDWQASDSVSWESLAQQIKIAEDDIKAYCRYSPAPDWEAVDVRPWPTHFRRDLYNFGWGSRDPVGINTSYDYIIAPGRRAVTAIQAGAVVAYSDPDGDGYNELATITASTSITDTREIKVYFAGKGGAREWEVRPIKSKVVSAGIVSITINAWQLVEPSLRELPPTINNYAEGLDLFDSSVYVTTLDIYREYTDMSAVSAEMFWASDCVFCLGAGCASCQLGTVNGCLRIISVNPGVVQASPASYDSDTALWANTAWPTSSDPVQVNLWYLAGFQDNEYLAGRSYEPLSNSFAQCIAWMATARLERPFCGCGTATALANRLRMDMAVTDGDGGKTYSFEDLENPFGTRLGEVWAWKRLKKLEGKKLGGYAA